MTVAPIRRALEVPLPREPAFALFAAGLASWWPPEYTWAGQVEAAFVGEAAARTRVELEHRGFERHGEGGAGYREALDSDRGWPYILDRYAAAAAARGAGEAAS